jgi:hypothetical protein
MGGPKKAFRRGIQSTAPHAAWEAQRRLSVVVSSLHGPMRKGGPKKAFRRGIQSTAPIYIQLLALSVSILAQDACSANFQLLLSDLLGRNVRSQ